MKHYEIVGYTYEAGVHCDGCAAERFGLCDCDQQDVHGEDDEGNEIVPLFAGDCDGSEICEDCGEPLFGELSAPDAEALGA